MKKILVLLMLSLSASLMLLTTVKTFAAIQPSDSFEFTLTVTNGGIPYGDAIADNNVHSWFLNQQFDYGHQYSIDVELETISGSQVPYDYSEVVFEPGVLIIKLMSNDNSMLNPLVLRFESNGYVDATESFYSISDGQYKFKLKYYDYSSNDYQSIFFDVDKTTYQIGFEGGWDDGYWNIVEASNTTIYSILSNKFGENIPYDPIPLDIEFYSGPKDKNLFENAQVYAVDSYYEGNYVYTYYVIQSIHGEFSARPDHFKMSTDSIYYPNFQGQDNVVEIILNDISPTTWNKSYSYGRLIGSNSVNLNHQNPDNILTGDGTQDEGVYISNISSNSRNFDFANMKIGEEILVTSPYQKFMIRTFKSGDPLSIYQRQDVAAVSIKKVTTNLAWIRVWYWDNGEISYDDAGLKNLYQNGSPLQIMFTEGLRKAISGQDVLVANVDELVLLESFLDSEYLQAWDDIDGDITDKIFIKDDGGYKADVVGTYYVTFAVLDSENQESSIVVQIHVVDITKPVITGVIDTVQISYHQDFNVSNWVQSLTVTDNYYTNLTITIKENTYSLNKNIPGNYYVTVQAIDGSGNVGTLTREILVVDGLAPVFVGLENITTSINESITVEQIKAGIGAVDEIDGNVTHTIIVEYDELTGNSNTPGVYQVTFRAHDSSGNQSFLTVNVIIKSAPPGFFFVNGKSIRLLPGANLTLEQIMSILDLNVSNVQYLSTNYDPEVPGTYQLSFSYLDEDFEFEIIVLGVNDPIIPVPDIPNTKDSFNWIYYSLGGLILLSLIGIIIYRRKK